MSFYAYMLAVFILLAAMCLLAAAAQVRRAKRGQRSVTPISALGDYPGINPRTGRPYLGGDVPQPDDIYD